MKRHLIAIALTALSASPLAAQQVGVNVQGNNNTVEVVVNSPPAPFAQDVWQCGVRWWKPDGSSHTLQILYEFSYDTGQYREYHDNGSGFRQVSQARFEYVTSSKIVLQDGTGSASSPYEHIAKHEGTMMYDEGREYQRGNCRRR